jgi:hypothetical protein
MAVYRVIEVMTSDKVKDVEVKEVEGIESPNAVIMNYEAHGYGKFKITR